MIALAAPLLASPAWAQTNDPAVNQGGLEVIAWILVGLLIAGYPRQPRG